MSLALQNRVSMNRDNSFSLELKSLFFSLLLKVCSCLYLLEVERHYALVTYGPDPAIPCLQLMLQCVPECNILLLINKAIDALALAIFLAYSPGCSLLQAADFGLLPVLITRVVIFYDLNCRVFLKNLNIQYSLLNFAPNHLTTNSCNSYSIAIELHESL